MQEATQEAGIKGTQVRKETSRKEEEENEDDEAECSSCGRTCDTRSRKDGGKEIGRSGSGERSREETRTEKGGGSKKKG